MRIKMLMGVGCAVFLSTISHAAVPSWDTNAPPVNGSDIANYIGVSNDVNNILGGDDNGTYLASDRPAQGQTFTTGSNPQGYTLNAITLQHVNYNTWWSLDSGWDPFNGRFEIKVGTITTGAYSVIRFETTTNTTGTTDPESPNALLGGNGQPATGTSSYLTLTLAEPVNLSPDTVYAFSVWSIADQYGGPYVELNGDGTTSANYAGGEAFSESANVVTDRTGDRVFHLDMVTNEAAFLSIAGTPTTPAPDTSRLLEAVIVDGASSFESAILYLDDNPVKTNSTSSGTSTNVISYTATGLIAGIHTCKVDVVSIDSSPAVAQSHTWTFEVVPFEISSVAPVGYIISDSVNVEAVITEGASIVDTGATKLYLDGVDTGEVADRSGEPATVISYAASGLSHGVHTGRVVAVGNPAGGPITNEWTFNVILESNIVTDLVHHWDFEEGVGTNVSDIVGGKHGVIVGTNHAWVAGGLELFGGGTSAGWDPDSTNTTGLGSYVNLSNAVLGSLSNAVTFEVTFTPGTTWPNQYLYTFCRTTSEGYSSGGTRALAFLASDGGSTASLFYWDGINPDHSKLYDNVNASAHTGTITHAVWVYDADGLMSKLYVDGVLVDAQLSSSFPMSDWVGGTVDENNWIGRSPWDDGLFEGLIYDLRIYNGIMTASEVADRYAEIGGGLTVNPYINSLSYAGGTVTLIWNVKSGATYNILSKSALTGAWSTNKAGIVAPSDGTYTDSVPDGAATVQFYTIEGQ